MTSEAGRENRRVRIIVGIIILMISIALLVWGVMPARRETRVQPISPTELQLPTPASFHINLRPAV
ncbi:MAG TPA: hypothetical protein VK897_28205 [Anaerolineales bacterium]|nr:hypothetical protein [Anaerolineales bacterium]